jgi:hypothetical protein
MEALLLMSLLVAPQPPENAPAPAKNAAFERLKSLEGTWTGAAYWDEGGQKGQGETTIVYKVTAGGKTVLETISPGTPHEMMTMYYMDGADVVLTHYCMAGNQPRMKLTSPKDADVFTFEYAGGTNVTDAGMHMHGLKLSFLGPDHIKGTWSSRAAGKSAGDAVFDLQRKK